MKLAAIDIGSNAARLLITEVVEENNDIQFNKLNLIRVPLRLGFDVFEFGEISKDKTKMLIETMKAYAHLMKAYGVEDYVACATSAMRDTKNSADLIRKVKLETSIEIKIISGDEEASMIYENHIAENLDKQHAYLYMDVGGGSTELTLFDEGNMKFKKSFNIGTIRLLKGLVTEANWNEMKDHIKLYSKTKLPITAIGSGGNINKIFSISKKKEGKPIQLDLLKDYHKEFSNFTVAERIKLYKFREDRADVIVPALQIYINAMRWADANEIYVPKIGLADGLIQKLYSQLKSK